MQNQHYHPYAYASRSEAPNANQGFVGMSDYLNMSFDQLLEHGRRLSTASFDLLNQLEYGSAPTNQPTIQQRPHVNFDAIHALQGASGPFGYGYGTFDLAPNMPSRVTRGLTRRAFKRLERVQIVDNNAGECHICMETLKNGAHCTRLPCQHLFCCACIKEWLKNNNTCPVCRYKFPDNQTHLINVEQ